MGQKRLFFAPMDSLEIGYRSLGHDLDSIDASFIGQLNLRPAAGFGQLYERNLVNNIFADPSGLAYRISEKRVKPKFTGLPYLGFQYAFGTALNQALNVEYHQFFKPNTHLHLRYNRRTSNGVIRNSDFKLNDVSLRFYHQKKRYATHLSGYYAAYDIAQNSGLTSDSLIETFEPFFIPVMRTDARSKVRKLDLQWDNYFRLIGDSVTGYGLKTRHEYSLTGRKFVEQLADLSFVDSFYIDTNGTTRDQYQTARFSNGAGMYFSSKHFEIDGSINYSYWRNQNLGRNNDTNEVFLQSNLSASLGERLDVRNQFYFNFIGAIGEIKNRAKLTFRPFQKVKIKGQLNFENVYPDPYQRFHVSNYNKWKIQELEMQQKLQLAGAIKYGDTNSIQAKVGFTSIKNGRYFIGNEWRQDTLDFVTVGSLNLRGELHLGQWTFYPTVTMRINSDNFNYQPAFSTLNRISFSTKLFKAQKLGLALGVDLGYETGYQFMKYNGVLGLLEPTQTTQQTSSLYRVNAFMALAITQFRFFVKGENISYFLNDQTTSIDVGYPIMPFLLRVGITWDFFN